MARPKTKEELVQLGKLNFTKLRDYIATFPLPEQEKEFPKGTMNRNIRDVLAHLHEWHLMMMDWYKVGMTGEKPDMPAKGYTWKTVPLLNRVIFEKYAHTDLTKIKKLVAASHNKLQKIIEQHSDEELFEKKRYKWTGSTSLGAYLISATSSHYDWAYKMIKKAKRG